MKIHILSDLHCEFAPFVPDPRAVEACDVVVLAGDIDTGSRGIAWARAAFGDKPVLYVAGNHEFYREHWTELLDEMREQARRFEVHFLENQAIDIDGIRFLGCTLWTDFRFFPGRPTTGVLRGCVSGMNDFHLIRADPVGPSAVIESPAVRASEWAKNPGRARRPGKVTPHHMKMRHRTSVDWLAQELNTANLGGVRPVVITHHLPSARSVEPRYLKDDRTAAFASRLDALIPSAALWIHGHTHASMDYTAEDGGLVSRVVCNPRGYPASRLSRNFENPQFQSDLIVEC